MNFYQPNATILYQLWEVANNQRANSPNSFTQSLNQTCAYYLDSNVAPKKPLSNEIKPEGLLEGAKMTLGFKKKWKNRKTLEKEIALTAIPCRPAKPGIIAVN